MESDQSVGFPASADAEDLRELAARRGLGWLSLACAGLIAIIVFVPSIDLALRVDTSYGGRDSFYTLALIPDVPGLGVKYLAFTALLAILGAAARGWVRVGRWPRLIPLGIAVVCVACMALSADVSVFCPESSGFPCGTPPFDERLNGDLANAIAAQEPSIPADQGAAEVDGTAVWWVLYLSAPVLLIAAVLVAVLPIFGARTWPIPFVLVFLIAAVFVLAVALILDASHRHGFEWN